MPDASPAKWHLAHTSWFFETFVLGARRRATGRSTPRYRVLFNSYYDAVGEQHFRARARAAHAAGRSPRCCAYRAHVDARVSRAARARRGSRRRRCAVVELGLHHEQQHQELILTDLKHLLARNPLAPGVRARSPQRRAREREPAPLALARASDAGLREIGHAGPGFAFDNEGPRHRVFVHAFALASRARDQRRVPRVHRGRRLPAPRALALRRLRRGAARAAGARRSTGRSATAPGTTFTLGGPARARARRAGRHVELLRGRRLRALGRRAPADRGRVGARRRPARRSTGNFVESGAPPPGAAAPAARRPRPALRRRLGVDARAPTRPTPASARPPARSASTTASSWQPARAARRLVRDAALAHPRELPQLLPARRALAVQRHPPRARRVARGGSLRKLLAVSLVLNTLVLAALVWFGFGPGRIDADALVPGGAPGAPGERVRGLPARARRRGVPRRQHHRGRALGGALPGRAHAQPRHRRRHQRRRAAAARAGDARRRRRRSSC